MGRIADLIAEVAEQADPGEERLELPPEVRERLRQEWDEEDIESALELVHKEYLREELVATADSLTARMMDVLGEFGSPQGFQQAKSGGAVLTLEVIGQLVRRVNRVEEVLNSLRDDPPPDRRGFDALRRRLMDLGIEKEMAEGRPEMLIPGIERNEEPDDDE